MIHTVSPATAAFLTALAMAGSNLLAQDVLISEVRADGLERWVEINNRGVGIADLSLWSLHYATHTPGQPQEYWWAFPAGTELAPNGFLRVHWYQSGVTDLQAGELYTGTSPYGFLFGLGGEVLHGEAGAFALFASQANAQMTSASVIRDWVSWGQHGYSRESLAIQAGFWNDGVNCPAIPAGSSLARNVASIGTLVTRDLEWFVDPTPTPLQPNLTGASVSSYGQACTVLGHHLLGTPQLHATSLPLLGSAQFGCQLDNTTGLYGESALVAFSLAEAPAGLPSLLPPVAGPTCRETIDTRLVVACWIQATHAGQTNVPISLANASPAFSGLELHAQVMVFDWLPNAWPPYQGVSNALRIVLGQ